VKVEWLRVSLSVILRPGTIFEWGVRLRPSAYFSGT